MNFKHILSTVGMMLGLASPLAAQAALTVTPLTWNVIGLDSNSPATGPKNFPVGARVCSNVATTNVNVNFVWDSANANVNLRPGSLGTLNLASIAPGACADAYFEVAVTQVPAAYDTTRRYHITATDVSGTASTPTPRELYVEHLISQNRNTVSGVKLDGLAIPPGGAMNLLVGNTYAIELDGGTATQGYEQFEAFINFPNTIFQVLSVNTTYSANTSVYVSSPNDKLYADACRWENNPGSPNYRSCVGTAGKTGGSTVVTTYMIKIIGGGSSSQPLNTLLYDFSGSSYHYNSDYSTGTRIANIIGPNSITMNKKFVPDAITPGGTSTLTLTLNNPTTTTIGDVNFADTFPVGTQVAATPAASTTGCGTPTFAPAAGATALSFSNGTLAPNSSCIIKVNVTAASAGSYVNTTGNLFINGTVDTGNFGTATLTAAAAGASCTPGQTLARWTVPVGTVANPPDLASGAPSTKAANVAQAALSALIPASSSIVTTGGSNDTTAWSTWGYKNANQYVQFVIDTQHYSGVSMSYNVKNDGTSVGPTSLTVSYDKGAGLVALPSATVNNPAITFVNHTIDLTGLTNTGGNTTIRIFGTGANNDNGGAGIAFDDIQFTGCSVLDPAPTLSKSFSPSTIAANTVSTLSFAIGNAQSGNVALTNVQFSDPLPTGLQVAATPNAGVTGAGCTGVTFAPVAGATTLSYTASNMTAGANCTAHVDVVATQAGQFDNVSGYITSAQSGPNKTANGYGTATLAAIAAPIIEKAFASSPILTGDTTGLSFTITNPNQSVGLSGIQFTDNLPAGVTVATSSSAQCGGTLNTINPDTISFSGGTLAGALSCTFSVTVTGATAGTKNNVTGNVSSTEGGTGNTASSTLVVRDLTPAISLRKEVGPTSSGPWTSFTALDQPLPKDVYFRFNIENTGDAALSNVSVVESTFPGLNLSDCSAALSGGLPLYGFQTCIAGPVNVTVAGAYTNTANAQGDYNATSYFAPNSTVTYASTDVTLVKSATETYFLAAGNVLHYSYLVTNTGSAPLIGPVSVSYDKTTVSCPAATTVGNGDDYLNPGESVTCTATYTVLGSDVTAGSVTNIAAATVGGVTSPTSSVTIPLAPDLSVAKANDVSGTVVLGNTFVWTLTVSNAAGAGTATFANGQTLLTDDLPNSGASYSAGSVSLAGGTTGTINCAIAANTLSCTASGTVAIPAGASFAIPVTVTPTLGGSLANPRAAGTCMVDPSTVIPEIDETNNNCVQNTVTVTTPMADLSITKTDGVASINAGASTTYTIAVTNNGPSAVTGAILTDAAATGLTKTAVACSGTPGACVSAPNVSQLEGGSFALPLLASGATYQITVTATVTTTSGSVSNTATIAPPGGTTDPTPGNNSATDTDSVTANSPAGSISGHIWFDINGNKLLDPIETGRAGWQVELVSGGTTIATTTTTDAAGLYTFGGLAAGTYSVRFINPNGGVLSSGPTPVNGETGTPVAGGGTPGLCQLTNIVLTADGGGNVNTIAQQSLPLDPSGVVYNSVTRQPISGATVTLLFNGSPINPAFTAGNSATQVTGVNGAYAFFLLPGAPAGTYSLSVSAVGYVAPSTLIPPTPVPGGFVGGAVTAIAGAPQNGQSTTYYQQFPLPSIDIINNNLPLDPPVAATPIQVPTLNVWGLLLTVLLVSAAGMLARRKV